MRVIGWKCGRRGKCIHAWLEERKKERKRERSKVEGIVGARENGDFYGEVLLIRKAAMEVLRKCGLGSFRCRVSIKQVKYRFVVFLKIILNRFVSV